MFSYKNQFISRDERVRLPGFEPIQIGEVAETAADTSNSPELDKEEGQQEGGQHHGTALVFVAGDVFDFDEDLEDVRGVAADGDGDHSCRDYCSKQEHYLNIKVPLLFHIKMATWIVMKGYKKHGRYWMMPTRR